ncbi:hypothetical protein [Micromonospora maritima]|uniref:hypothetical protein n=1 Tax=Micromonospora maritima TaxID=986711 RepID=UPI00157C0888|nr:hypothetical protein [Micromonospora maritima]
MNLTPYEQLTPDTIARSDQGLARIAERAKTLGKLTAVPIYPTPGDVCAYTDCADPAAVVVAALYGRPDRADVPVCAAHWDGGSALEPILWKVIEVRGLPTEPGINYIEVLP